MNTPNAQLLLSAQGGSDRPPSAPAAKPTQESVSFAAVLSGTLALLPPTQHPEGVPAAKAVPAEGTRPSDATSTSAASTALPGERGFAPLPSAATPPADAPTGASSSSTAFSGLVDNIKAALESALPPSRTTADPDKATSSFPSAGVKVPEAAASHVSSQQPGDQQSPAKRASVLAPPKSPSQKKHLLSESDLQAMPEARRNNPARQAAPGETTTSGATRGSTSGNATASDTARAVPGPDGQTGRLHQLTPTKKRVSSTDGQPASDDATKTPPRTTDKKVVSGPRVAAAQPPASAPRRPSAQAPPPSAATPPAPDEAGNAASGQGGARHEGSDAGSQQHGGHQRDVSGRSTASTPTVSAPQASGSNDKPTFKLQGQPATDTDMPSGEEVDASASQASSSDDGEPGIAARPARPSSASQLLSASWHQKVLSRSLRTASLSNGWKMLEMKLEEGDGTVTIKARRGDEKVAVSVGFSDPNLRALASTNANQLQEALQAQYDSAVDFSLMQDGADAQHDRSSAEQPASAASSTVSAPEEAESQEDGQAVRPRHLGAQHEWIG